MLTTIKSHKFQEEISFYTEDIGWNENRGTMTAPGVGDRTGHEYDVILDESGQVIRDFKLHNT